MRHRIDLPGALGTAFSVQDAAALGIGRGRLDARDLARPFHGVRARATPDTFAALAHSAATRLVAGQRFSGLTALRCWGLPLHRPWRSDEALTVASPTGSGQSRAAGVHGVRLARERAVTWSVHGLPVVDPIAALFSSARFLGPLEIVVIIDALLSPADNYPGLHEGRPVFTATDIADRLAEWGAFPGCRMIRRALLQARAGVESPKETETRMLITRAGLPEPVVQYEVRLDGHLVARTDLAYPELRIAVEYEGDGHRTDSRQWRLDIRRQRELEDCGWIVIRLTQHDLGAGAASFLTRLRRAIASRSSASRTE